MERTALIVGATGLVGKALLRLLLEKDYYQKIVILSRRELDIKDNRIQLIILDDFDKMQDVAEHFNVQDVYCALGTTMKRAGSKDMFKKIDLEWPVKLASIVKDQPNFEQFLVVTSHGANADSPLFYNGEVEEELKKLALKSLKIFRPSLLIGYRDEFRILEEIAKFFSALFSFFMIGAKNRLWTIRGTEVASAMYKTARRNDEGLITYKPSDMIRLAA